MKIYETIDKVLRETYYTDDSGKQFWGAQGAGVLPIASSTGRILIAHRSPHVEQPGTYGVWGGAIDPGENPKQAAKRELAEEAGYRGRIKMVDSHVYTSPGGDFKYYNYLGIVEEEFEPRMDWETQGYRWVTWNELNQMRSKLHFGLEELIDEDSRTILKYAISERDQLDEMAAARPSAKKKTFYHGTKSKKAAESIMRSGIQPPDLTDRSGDLRPMEGKVYLTDDLKYAIIYAIGGSYLGHEAPERFIDESEYGYVFVIPGRELNDIVPDEDSVGALLGKVLKGKAHRKFNFLEKMGRRLLSRQDLRRIEMGEYAYYAKAGKLILPQLSEKQIYLILSEAGEYLYNGPHIAHTGAIDPSEVWRIDKRKTDQLESDGSNFFEVAEKVRG